MQTVGGKRRAILSLLLFLVITCYFFCLVWVYKVNHFSSFDTINNDIPNVNEDCYYDYYNVRNSFNENEISESSKIRYRKEITLNQDCLGKVSGVNIIPGTKLEEIEPGTYISFNVNQSKIFNLWLFEVDFLIFLSLFMTLLFAHVVLFRKELFNVILLIIFIYSLVSFSSENMFINSPKKYFPNQDVTNSNIFIEEGLN